MRRYNNTVQGSTGQAIAGATVAVTVAATPPGSGALVTLYSDNGITVLINPLITDAFGRFAFFIPAGNYDLSVSGGSPTVVPYVLANEQVADVVGQAISVSNFALSPRWGSGATFSVTGTSSSFVVTITAGTSPSFTPFVTFTYPTPLVVVPQIISTMIGGTGVTSDMENAPTLTNVTYTFDGLPVAGNTYIFVSHTLGA